MSEKKYIGRFSTKLPDGNFLNITIWPGKSTPNTEVIVTQIRRNIGDKWETVARIAVFRTQNGEYLLLPERER